MLDFLIRPVTIDDAQDINSIRRMDGVRENTMSLFSERYTKSEDFIESLGDSDHMLVAVIKEDGVEKVIGAISLNVYKNLRANHCASVGIMVHRDYQGMGVGTALFRKVLDLADNWLMLIRVELTVYTENSGAVRLYRSLGFEIEGIKRFSAKRYGRYADEYIMARYNRLMINVAEIAYTAANAGSMSPEVYKQVTGSGGIEANGLKSRPDGGIEIETENSAENCSGNISENIAGNSAENIAGNSAGNNVVYKAPLIRKLETDRLILRPWQISDIEDFYEYAKNPNVGPAAGWEPHKDILTTGHILQQFLNKDEVWALVYKENGRVIGSLGVHNDDKRKGVRARMVGYALSEEYWGRGIMTEAVKEVIRYMFENAGFDVLSCYHYPFNDRSRRVIEKSGFRYDGTLRHASMVFDGKTYDDVCYSITRSEWNFEREAGI